MRSTISGIERIAELGLGCMEIEFVRGVKMSEQTAIQVSEAAAGRGIKLSAHAPYYMNFNAREEEKIKASQSRLMQTARIASLCGVGSIVFHAAYYLDDPPGKVYNRVKDYLRETLRLLKREDNRVRIRAETAGAVSEFGTLDELLKMCTELEGLSLCIDFAHLHARTARFNSYPEFAYILLQISDRLGKTALDDMHIHVSGIDYGDKGERKHLNLRESDLQFAELLRALRDYDVKGIVICESPNLEEDALLLQETYHKFLKTV
jgi:deoxyribonuclease-4